MRDRDIRLLMAKGMTVEQIADEYGFSVDSLRGRLSRTSLEDRVSIIKELASVQPVFNSGVARQQAVLLRAEQTFQAHQQKLSNRGTLATGMFISDLHLPYTNWAALYLILLIMQDVNPDYVSDFNDLFDFEGYSSWPDNRTPAQKLWSDDIWNGLKTSAEIHQAYRKAAPNALFPQVQGNHDNWMYSYLRSAQFRNGYSEHNVADFMEEMERQGSVQFVDGGDRKENIVTLSPGLRWVHGITASISDVTVAKKTSEACQDPDNEGVFFDTTGGHTHRSFVKKINGRKHYNSGCVMLHDPRYLKHRPAWDTAIVINRFDPNSRYSDGVVVEIKKRGGRLVARYDGVDYDAPIE